MNPVAIAFAVAVPAAFVAGVLFSKSVLGEAFALKQHVTEAEIRIREDISSLLGKAAKKVG